MDLSSKIISMRATIISWSTFLFSSIGYIFMREHFHQYSEYTYCNFSNRTLTDPSECLLCLVWTSWLSILHHSHLGFVPCTHGHMFRRWIWGCCTFESTEWWLTSRLARYRRIGSCCSNSMLVDRSSSQTSYRLYKWGLKNLRYTVSSIM